MLPLLIPSLVLAAGGPLAELGPVPQGKVRIFLVRHGEAFSNLQPAPDLPPAELDRLTDAGRAQSVRAGRALSQLRAASVLCSPAGRAKQSAEEIARVLGTDVAVERRLRPLDLGRDGGGEPLSWDQRIEEWKAGRDPAPPGGESLEQVGRRVLALIEDLARGHAGKSVVLVAHSEVIGAAVGAVRGTPAAKRFPPGIDMASITVLEATPPKVLLLSHVPPPTATP